MPRTVLLNNVDHAGLRVHTQPSAARGDDVMLVTSFPGEFRQLLAHYPIVFRKPPDAASFEPVALLGLRPGCNLFLGESGWRSSPAPYLPLALERLPFYIGRGHGDGAAGGDGAEAEWVLHIDLDSPRIVQGELGKEGDEGEALFLPHGGLSPLLERINSVMLAIHEGVQATPAFVAALLQHGLLEPFVLDYTDGHGRPAQLSQFYTVHEERLAALDGAALAALSRAGHLQAAHWALASLSQFPALIERQRAHDVAAS